MSSFLNLPSPPLPPSLRALQASAIRQEPGSGYSANIRPVRARLRAADCQPNPFPPPLAGDGFGGDDGTGAAPAPAPARNETLLQGFEWYVPADGAHWRRLEAAMPALAALGVTAVWIPPACRAADPAGNGYDAYDLWDLGEFARGRDAGNEAGAGGGGGGGDGDHGGASAGGDGAEWTATATATKWGTKAELVRLGEEAARRGVRLLFDAVLNHKAGADYCESARARRVDDRDRTRELPGGARAVGAWTGFDFPGRAGRYSRMRWNKEHFTGVDYDQHTGERGVWKLEGKEWADDVDEELGNYDFLLFADIDHRHPEVRNDMFRWVEWLARQVKLGGLRLDAVKHYSFTFVRDLVSHIRESVDPDWLIVGEYWREDSEYLARFVEFMGHQISLFDVQLVSNFSRVSQLQEKGDLRTVLDDALVLWKPDNAVTFVVNHDTQAGQSLETPIAPFFMPLAYALILLRADCGLPCVFYGDLFGSVGQHPQPGYANFIPPTAGGAVLPRMMLARKLWAYGAQYDYFDDPGCVGFIRTGHRAHSGGHGLAVVMTNAWEHASKAMFVGAQHAGEVWTDLLRWCPGQVVIGPDGWAAFPVGHRSVAVWVNAVAPGRAAVDNFVFDYDIYGLKKAEGHKLDV